MTINRQWIAREWLYLLAGFLWAYVLLPIFVPPLARLVLWIFTRLYGPASNVARSFVFELGPIIMFGPYVIFQLVRMTRWAIRTLRETEGG